MKCHAYGDCRKQGVHYMPWRQHYCDWHYNRWFKRKERQGKLPARPTAFDRDPVFGQLHDLAENAEAMTPELWAEKLADFQRHPARSAVPRVGERIA